MMFEWSTQSAYLFPADFIREFECSFHILRKIICGDDLGAILVQPELIVCTWFLAVQVRKFRVGNLSLAP